MEKKEKERKKLKAYLLKNNRGLYQGDQKFLFHYDFKTQQDFPEVTTNNLKREL